MNRIDFNQSIGFPLETEILDAMQDSYKMLNAFGFIAGNFSIISGCTVVGSSVTNGFVFLNGELLPFIGGTAQPNVVIVEVIESYEFEDFTDKQVLFKRHVTFGSSVTQYPWTDFKRSVETKTIPDLLSPLIERIEELEARPISNVPIGLVAIWGQPAADIPEGWAEYIPLKGRLPIGLDATIPRFDTLLEYGGSATHINTLEEMVEHNHPFTHSSSDGSGTGTQYVTTGAGNEGAGAFGQEMKGEGEEYSIMNPYRVVHFIVYEG